MSFPAAARRGQKTGRGAQAPRSAARRGQRWVGSRSGRSTGWAGCEAPRARSTGGARRDSTPAYTLVVTNGFIVQPTYRVRDGAAVLQLFGRLESGEPFLVEEHRYRPYFFVLRGEERLLGDAALRVEETPLRDTRGRALVRVSTALPAEVMRLRERVRAAGGTPFEADIRFPYRFLMDRGLRATCAIHGPHDRRSDGLLLFRNPELKPASANVALRTLSLDLETTPDASRVLSAALLQDEVEEVHLVAKRAVPGAIVHPEEPALLSAVNRRIRQLDPDLIVGWNVIGFDLAVWFARCDARRIPRHLGRTTDAARILDELRGGRSGLRADVPGRMVLDALPLVREAIRLPDYRLETAATQLLGRGKVKIAHDAPDAAAEILRLWREDPEALVAYNIEDARLVRDILAREGLLALSEERSRLTGMQLDRVSASIANFDLLYLPELRSRNVVAPCVAPKARAARVQGGALLTPRAGFHERVAALDFKSLYPSLIRSFGLDPLAHARAAQESEPIVAPNGARFAREGAALPAVIERLMERRAQARARGDRHASQAIKIMMNALFGVLGAPSCRFFDPDVANAITSFGQQTLHWTKQAFEEAGVPVLYGDTDSVFIQLPEAQNTSALARSAEQLRAQAERQVAERIRRRYRIEPCLELELETIFERFFLPRVRGGKSGSKKRYAGWADGKLVIVGLEAVRRDWPAVATRLQQGLLERLFTQRDPVPFMRELVTKLRAGQLDRELVYVKRIRKGSLERYASNPPHIQAARLINSGSARSKGWGSAKHSDSGLKPRSKGGPGRSGAPGARADSTIRYLITRHGPEPVLPGSAWPADIDHEHYVDRVLRPVADSILQERGQRFAQVLGEPSQLPLL